jgi:hypothetical protein
MSGSTLSLMRIGTSVSFLQDTDIIPFNAFVIDLATNTYRIGDGVSSFSALSVPAFGGAGTAVLTLSDVTENGSGVVLPEQSVIIQVLIVNTSDVAVSVALGTTIGAADILAVTAVPASGLLTANPTSLLQQAFMTQQSMFLSSTAWDGASLNLKVWYVQ